MEAFFRDWLLSPKKRKPRRTSSVSAQSAADVGRRHLTPSRLVQPVAEQALRREGPFLETAPSRHLVEEPAEELNRRSIDPIVQRMLEAVSRPIVEFIEEKDVWGVGKFRRSCSSASSLEA